MSAAGLGVGLGYIEYVRAAWRLAGCWGDERGWVRVRVRVHRVRTGGVEAGGQLG